LSETNDFDRRVIFGIDIGVTGAVAMLKGKKLEWVHDTPTFQVTIGKKKRNRYNVALCHKMLHTWIVDGDTHAILEDIRALPKMSSLGAMVLGYGQGMWAGIVSSLHIPMEVVLPGAWKKEMLRGMDCKGDAAKEAARVRACQLFPDSAERFGRKKDHNRAEAVLQAEYLRRLLDGTDKEES
jgi:crossover junction endodeoxyribonuclease RuvC